MGNELTVPKTLLEAVKKYSDPKACFDLMVEIRWPGRVTCPRCASERVTLFANRPMFKCNACKKQFSVKVGTIFEDSPLGLEKWLPTLWLLANCKNGISSCEVARDLGVTQKTAWFMLHRIRHAIKQGSIEKMDGPVEADETFIGGLEKNKHEDKKLHKGRGPVGKSMLRKSKTPMLDWNRSAQKLGRPSETQPLLLQKKSRRHLRTCFLNIL